MTRDGTCHDTCHHVGFPQPTLFSRITSDTSVGKFLDLSSFIMCLWKSKLTPWCLPSPLVHVLLHGPCVWKVRPLVVVPCGHFGPPRPSIIGQKIIFFSFHGRVRPGQIPPSVIRSGWYKCAKTTIRHPYRIL